MIINFRRKSVSNFSYWFHWSISEACDVTFYLKGKKYLNNSNKYAEYINFMPVSLIIIRKNILFWIKCLGFLTRLNNLKNCNMHHKTGKWKSCLRSCYRFVCILQISVLITVMFLDFIHWTLNFILCKKS